MGKTRYYDPLGDHFKSMFTWNSTVFELVFKRLEFYMYIVWNIVITSIIMYAVEEGIIDEFNWDSASIMQYVMTFFVTFYNDRCYERYMALYPACNEFMDNVLNLVQEMNIAMPWRDLHYHRLAITKYTLAIVYEYFMIVCGGKLSSRSRKELRDKGLLNEEECRLLAKFPGSESTLVLTSWCLFIMRDALVQDCMWRKPPPEFPDWQPEQTVHIFNRHCSYVVEMQRACHRIGYTMANPIPFAYYHLMNVILVFNILMLATFSALFRSYVSVFPFAVALIVYMGMREISCALADPFGRDSVDFPVPDFMRACFDNTVSQLLAFSRPDTREKLIEQIQQVQPFQDHHLRRSTTRGLFTTEVEEEPAKGISAQSRWSADSVFEDAKPDIETGKRIRYSLSKKELPEEHKEQDPAKSGANPHKQLKKDALKATRAELKLQKELRIELQGVKDEYNYVVGLIDEMVDKYPQLHSQGGAVYVPKDIGKAQMLKKEETDDLLDLVE